MLSISQGRKCRRKTNQKTLFPDPAMKTSEDQGLTRDECQSNARFPCIHKKEPVDFH